MSLVVKNTNGLQDYSGMTQCDSEATDLTHTDKKQNDRDTLINVQFISSLTLGRAYVYLGEV